MVLLVVAVQLTLKQTNLVVMLVIILVVVEEEDHIMNILMKVVMVDPE
jgi:hypothetical protein